MAFDLERWRTRGGLTQVEAAQALGVSQTYICLIEKGARPVTARVLKRVKALQQNPALKDPSAADDDVRAGLAALGYPAFQHLNLPSHRVDPAALLMQALRQPDLDARVTEGLPWLAAHCCNGIDWVWATRQAKLNDLQNRLGFLLDLTLPFVANPGEAAALASLKRARSELDNARLVREATFCWDSMPESARGWMRANRSPAAEHWNVLTRLRGEDLTYDV